MLNRFVVLLLTLALGACETRLHVGEDGTGGHAGAVAGAPGSPLGTGGLGGAIIGATGGAAAGSAGGSSIVTGTGGAAGQVGAGGAPVAPTTLSVNPGSATFGSTLVEAVSAPQTFTVRNDGNLAATTTTALTALAGTNAADFQITSSACGTTLQPGASCEVAIAFAPKTRSGQRTASLSVGASSNPAATVALTGTALPSLGLLAGKLGGAGTIDGTGATARFTGPNGMIGDGAGNLYVADGGHIIRKIVVTTLAGSPGLNGPVDGTGSAARFDHPMGLALDGAGNLYVADEMNQAIRKVVIATGVVTTIAGQLGQPGTANGRGTAAQFFYPSGITTDGAGNLYVAEGGNRTIRKVVVATGAVTTFAGTFNQGGSVDGVGAAARFDDPVDITSDGAGNLYVADASDDVIRKIVIATRAVTTLAGAALQFGSTDGSGAAALFGSPTGVASDGAGNLYVVDSYNDTIRKIVIATGAVTTLAGVPGQEGSANGIGAAARFLRPTGIARNGTGGLFVADNNTVREIALATGTVTTLAGTAGPTPSGANTPWLDLLNRPFGVATDGAGNLYVADTDSNVIRKVVLATGVMTTFAGSATSVTGEDGTGTAASFYQPQGIVGDGAGNLFVTDTSNDTIRKIVIATGAVTTLAGRLRQPDNNDGTGTNAGFENPMGIATDGAGNLYVADTSNNMIRKIVIATGAVTTLAGSFQSGANDGTGANATFNGPTGIAADGAGNVYVSDGNCTIRKIVIATGVVTTLAGTVKQCTTLDGTGTAAHFFEPYGIASDGAGNLYVADSGDDTIRKIVIATGVVTTFAGTPGQTGIADGTGAAARLSWPFGLVSDGAGNLYIADTGNNAIRKIAIASGAVTTVVAPPAPTGSADGIGSAAFFTAPAGITSDQAGNVYVADGNDTIRKLVVATKTVTTFAGAPGQKANVDGTGVDARFTLPEAIFGAGDNLYVADSLVIRQVTIGAAAVTTVAGNQDTWANQFAGPTGVVADGAGNLYVADAMLDTCNCVRKVVIATGQVTILAGGYWDAINDGTGTNSSFLSPRGIAIDGVGNLYVSDGPTIRKVVIATGVVTTFAGMASESGGADGIGASARFIAPAGIGGDGAGNLYVADGNSIRKIVVATGAVSTIIGTFGQVGVAPGAFPASLNTAVGVTVLPTGELAIVDSGENAVAIGHL
jgi:HYDIN/CFA65/VesB-like, Ig-like domain